MTPKMLAVFVAALPSPYREAVTLTELQGMSQRDAAEMLGISLSGMKSRVAPFFERRGFATVERSTAPEAMTKSARFVSLCPSTAACMALAL